MFEVKVPSVGESITEVQISQWLKQEGAWVAKDENIVELETSLADSLYQGYIASQRNAFERVNHYDNLKVPENFQFNLISGLSNEMVERLERAKPQTFNQVRKINGLTPTAISTVLIHLTSKRIQQPS